MYKRIVLTLLAALLLASLTLAQESCPVQPVLPTAGLDMSKVAINPVTGEPFVFLRLAGTLGFPIVITGRACDPDVGDPNAPPQQIRVWREPGDVTLPVDAEGYFTFTVSYPTPGKHYETVGVTDGFDVVKGTVVIDVYKPNRPPVLCGGLSQAARSR